VSNTRHVRQINAGKFTRPKGHWGKGQFRFRGIGLTHAEQRNIVQRAADKANAEINRITVAGTFRLPKQGDR
jgi:hypothetical protein